MKPRRVVVVGLSLVLLSGCGLFSPPKDTVGDYFSPPQAYPGPAWEKDDRSIDPEELNTVAGPDHCDWQSVVMMHLGWPLGTVARTVEQSRQFIRDPDGSIEGFRGQLMTSVELPTDARYTGYHLDELELWLSPSEPDGVYLRIGNDVERWPRADPVIACA
jgi:hypothetical protein